MNAICIDPAQIKHVWPLAAPWIQRAARRDDLSDFATIERNVLNGDLLLWLAVDGDEVLAAAVTELSRSNGKVHCTIVVCGGKDLDRWVDLIRDLEDFARNEKCNSVRIYGRKGWERALDGYHRKAVILEKGLG